MDITVEPYSNFVATASRIKQFQNQREPKQGDKIVYIQGSFDLFHQGHVETLKIAKEMGDFLYVGVWPDDVVNKYKEGNYPVLTLQERVLMVLSCKYVDDVVIGCPYSISKEMIQNLNISKVLHVNSNEDIISEAY